MRETHTIQWTLNSNDKLCTSPYTFTKERARQLCDIANKHFTNAWHIVTLAIEEET